MTDIIQPTIERDHAIGGTQRMYRFDNGYGASVVQFQFMGSGSYGADQGLWELAVIHYDGEDFKLVYDTPVAEDVVGWLDEDAIQEHLRQIRDLPVRDAAAEVTEDDAPDPVEPANPDRRCRWCGSASGLILLPGNPLTGAGRAHECADGCKAATR